MIPYKIVSSDDHMIETASLWEERVPKRFGERAPRFRADGIGLQSVAERGEQAGGERVDIVHRRDAHHIVDHRTDTRRVGVSTL